MIFPVFLEMAERSKVIRHKMKYEVMDVLKMTYDDKAFNAVLDKGTLDAMFPEDTPEQCQKIETMFDGIMRIINDNGYYICISLL